MSIKINRKKVWGIGFMAMLFFSTAIVSLGLLEQGQHDAMDSFVNPGQVSSSGVKEAIDNPSLTITGGGAAQWYEQSIDWLVGGSAAQSGLIMHSQESWFQTTVSGPFSLKFSWKVSSEQYCDYLTFTIDGNYVDQISGTIGSWQNKTVDVAGTGSHTLRWTYSKDSSVNTGSDAGWVDNVQIGPYNNRSLNIVVSNPSSSSHWYTNVYNYIDWSMTADILTSLDITLYKGTSVVATIASAISSGASGFGSTSWRTPTSLITGSDYHVRVTNHYNASEFDNSDDFTINATKTITVTSPSSSSTWVIPRAYDIYYQATGPIDSVEIDLYKGGAWIMDIADDESISPPYYYWYLPKSLEAGNDYRILVRDYDNASVYDFSDYFTISATKTINVWNPSSGNIYWVDDTASVYWDYTGPINAVDIELYKGAAMNRVVVSNLILPYYPSGNYGWHIPVDLVTGTDYRIRVVDHANASVFDFSDYFTINATKTISVMSPMYPVHEKDNTLIQWQYTGYIPYVDISLYKGGALQAQLVLNLENTLHFMGGYYPPGDAGNYLWDVWDGLTPGSDYQFRVSDHANTSVFGMSGMFTINNTKLIYVSVNSMVRVSQAAPVMWFALGGIATVDAGLYTWNGTFLFPIWSDVPMPVLPVNQRYWIVPANLTTGNYTIRISEHGNPAVFGTSNIFLVNATKTIQLNSPTNTTTWYVGHTYDVLWQTTGAISRVDISLYMGDSPIATIASNVSNNGRYTWTVPGSITETIMNYRVRVTDASNASLYVYSAFFLIDTTKAIQYVSATSQVTAGTTLFVNWASIGDIPSVNITLYKDGSANITLATGKTNDGYFSWLVPTGIVPGTGYSVRVCASGNATLYAESGSIQILAYNPPVNTYDVTVGDVITWSVTFNLTMNFPDAFWTALDDLAMNMGGVQIDSKQMYQNFVDTIPDAWILEVTIKSIVSTSYYEQIYGDVMIKEAGQPVFLPFGTYLQSFVTELRGALGILGQYLFPGSIQIPADIGNNVPIGNWYASYPGPFYIPGLVGPPSPILPVDYSWATARDDLIDYFTSDPSFISTWGTWENFTNTMGFNLTAVAQGWDFSWDLLQFNEGGPQYSGIGGIIDMYIAQFTMLGLNLSVSSLPATGSFRYTDDMIFDSLNAMASVTGTFTTFSGVQSLYSMDIVLSADTLSHDRINVAPVVSSPPDKTCWENTIGNNITWAVTDKTTGTTSYTVYRNGSVYGTPGSWVSGTPIVVNVDALAAGDYNFTIVVNDGLGLSAQDEVIITAASDNVAPVILSPFVDPTRVYNVPVTVRCNVTDGLSGVGTVTLWYAVNSNVTAFAPLPMTLQTGDTYGCSIPIQAYGSVVYYYYTATDRSGNAATLNNSGAYFTYTLDQLIPGTYTITFTTPVALSITIVVQGQGKLQLEAFNASAYAAGLNITTLLTSFNLSFTGSLSSLTIRYTYTGTIDVDLIRAFHWNGATWERIAPVVNPQTRVVTFTVTSLSPFVIGVIKAPPSQGFDIVKFLSDYWIYLVIAGGVIIGVAGAVSARRKKVSTAKAGTPRKKLGMQLPEYEVAPPQAQAPSKQPADQLEWAQPTPVEQGTVVKPPVPSPPEVVVGNEINLYCSTCQTWAVPAVKNVNGHEKCQQCNGLYYVVTKCTNCNSQGIVSVNQFNEFLANPSKCTKCKGILSVM